MRISLVLLFSLIAAAVAGCGGGGATAAGEPASASATLAAKPATVSTRKGQLGTFLVDGKGRTLYLFEKDTGKRSRCSGACAQASLLSTSRRGNGSRQVTYGGHPLYRFAPDTAPGQTLGQGVDGFGALWWVVARSGNAITSSSSPGY